MNCYRRLPAHSAELHSWVSVEFPGQVSLPPESGALHALDLILKPFPHEAVQCDHAAQSCHSEAMPAMELLAPSEAFSKRIISLSLKSLRNHQAICWIFSKSMKHPRFKPRVCPGEKPIAPLIFIISRGFLIVAISLGLFWRTNSFCVFQCGYFHPPMHFQEVFGRYLWNRDHYSEQLSCWTPSLIPGQTRGLNLGCIALLNRSADYIDTIQNKSNCLEKSTNSSDLVGVGFPYQLIIFGSGTAIQSLLNTITHCRPGSCYLCFLFRDPFFANAYRILGRRLTP